MNMSSTNINSAKPEVIAQTKTLQEIQVHFNAIKDANNKLIEASKDYLTTCAKFKPLIEHKNFDLNIKLSDKKSIKLNIEKCTALKSIVDEVHLFTSMIEEFNDAVNVAKYAGNIDTIITEYVNPLIESNKHINVVLESDDINSLINEIEGLNITEPHFEL